MLDRKLKPLHKQLQGLAEEQQRQSTELLIVRSIVAPLGGCALGWLAAQYPAAGILAGILAVILLLSIAWNLVQAARIVVRWAASRVTASHTKIPSSRAA